MTEAQLNQLRANVASNATRYCTPTNARAVTFFADKIFDECRDVFLLNDPDTINLRKLYRSVSTLVNPFGPSELSDILFSHMTKDDIAKAVLTDKELWLFKHGRLVFDKQEICTKYTEDSLYKIFTCMCDTFSLHCYYYHQFLWS